MLSALSAPTLVGGWFSGTSRTRGSLALTVFLALSSFACDPMDVDAQAPARAPESSPDLDIEDAAVRHLPDLDLLVFEIDVAGVAGGPIPDAAGQMDGAPVLGYVFPTTLSPEDVGFASGEGIVALAATSHPDFDDTPLWDEDGDRNYGNDGAVYHIHWVVLTSDDRVPGGLSVKETQQIETDLPPTNPGMPMYLDSPGFTAVLKGSILRVPVPLQRVANRTDFSFDAVTAYMEVNTSDDSRPLLGVYVVYDVLSGDLSLPYHVTRE